jgi:hypothetical protein
LKGLKMKKLFMGMLSALLFVGCSTSNTIGRQQQMGIGSGAVLGGVLGGVLGNNMGDGKNEVLGAAIGAALGAFTGSQYGARQDNVDQRIDAASMAANTTTVNIANTNGSYTPVTLRRAGGAWMGPRGEIYNSVPTDAQLKSVYGF